MDFEGPADIQWSWHRFADLTVDELYAILSLRQEVFVVEQCCAYQDVDGRDTHALHLLGLDGEKNLLAYLRLVEPGQRFTEPSIGRVITRRSVRGTGLGKALMTEALRKTDEMYAGMNNRISAQCYLERFYCGFGYVRDGEPYDEDDIPHIEMVRAPRSSSGIAKHSHS